MNKPTTKNAIVITGASRGIGLSLARNLLSPENHLVCISRQTNDNLVKDAANLGCSLDYINLDLSRSQDIEESLSGVLAKLQKADFSRICLVNNAGMLAPIKPMGRAESDVLAANFAVNATAPIMLMNLFIRYFRTQRAEKRIISISSGAADNPYPGWAAYCSAKAALKMATRCVHVEQENNQNKIKVMSFAPGVVDTSMQAELRNTEHSDFVLVERFRKLNNEGMLLNPDVVADRISELIFGENFPDGESMDIRR